MADEHKGWHSRGYLPHFDSPNVIQSITFRLADSLPGSYELDRALESVPDRPDARRQRLESLLDNGRGACVLKDPRAARIVEDALLYLDGERYRLLAWVVMPNHVHALVEIIEGHSLSRIMQSWKVRTARECNRVLGTIGRFWEPEYYDRYIRNERHLQNAILYIHSNPVVAGLVSEARLWPFGSARREHADGGLWERGDSR
ncbi:MAG: transposase [Anaerolineae bacterium]